MERSQFINKTATVLESVLPRLIDAALVLLLLRGLIPETVGLIERSQAIVIPLMLLFLSPEQLLYKNLSSWKLEKPAAHVGRVRALRRFCWLKGFLGYLLALLFSLRATGLQPALLCGFLWAFSRTLAPQVIGVDREYLRISGKMGQAFLLVFMQKILFFVGVLTVVLLKPVSALAGLAAVGFGSVVLSGLLGQLLSRQLDRQSSHSAPPNAESFLAEIRGVVREALVRFSLWAHVNYVAANTIESMDVLVLGVLGFPNRVVGIYGAAVRVANFSLALPSALATWFAVRLGQASRESKLRTSLAITAGPTLPLLAVITAQTTALICFAPFLAELLGTTRWTPAEKVTFARYLVPLALGVGIYSLTFVVMTWLKYCCDVKEIFWRISLPWLLFTAVTYFYLGTRADVPRLAWANVVCYSVYTLAVLLYSRIAVVEPVSQSSSA